MFIRPASDIHNEFSIYDLPVLDTDAKSVLVLAGDIGIAKNANSTLAPFFDTVADRFSDIVYIPGNHEYYNDGSLLRTDEKLEKVCKRYMNVHYLNRKSMLIHGVRFIGATLWTDLKNCDPLVMMEAQDVMNDYKCIRTGTSSEPYRWSIRPVNTFGINADHRGFIKDELESAKARGEKVVVFTHHAPSMMSRPRNMRMGPLDYAYYNDCGLEELMLDYDPAVWIHGHSHYPVDYMIGNTRVVSNPRGYSKNPSQHEGLGFLGDLVIEL